MNIKIYIALLFVLFVKSVVGQTALWTNDNSLLYIESGASLHVDGDVVHQNSAIVDNSGVIELDRDWINNNLAPVFLNNSPGIVRMTGQNQQIAGNTVTTFGNLNLKNAFLKELLVNSNVQYILDIEDSELQVHGNTMHLTNPSQTSLRWTSGFISGDVIGGYFSRSTNRNAPYMFPVGSQNLTNTYRAVELTPSSSDSAVYGVRLSDQDPDLDASGTSATGSMGPFPRANLSSEIFGVNDRFYHHIARFHGTSDVSTKVYYFQSDEILPYEFNSLAVWDNPTSLWSRVNFSVNFSNGLFSIGNPERFVFGNISNFSNDVYALAVKDKVTAKVPEIFSPNGNGLNDVLYVLGSEIDDLLFIVYNRWGEKVFETRDQSSGWDGTFRGKDAQSGVYVYYLKAGLSNNQEIVQSGDITLVR